ncbi:MinD/ParA family protein [Anaerosalibacter bizertensis]|uniref:MinD/ParA family protein n=1 Tax=Anaerosalibacter bizertensis TaxID=932217 RepID=A0A844FG90_9FIRM|nr:MinD/ParA family protein [Anaerosalibacter bizertensis]MSS42986.1 MinD/ParA family protein [Anaerosalibacter bizertensis]
MADQAEKLRKIMGKYSKKENINESKARKAKFIGVTSGKGGVGKTNFTVNLAISLRKLGYKVVIVDGDLGLANVDLITGTCLEYNISDIFLQGKSIFDIMTEGPDGIKIISGGSGITEFHLLNGENLNRFINEIEKLENYFDFIIMDTGAGISENVIKFLLLADDLVLLITPDPTSLMDGYALLKTVVLYGYIGDIKTVINMAGSKKEAEEVYNKLNGVSNRFLNRDVEFLDYLNKSSIVANAVKKQRPFVLDKPNSSVSKKINNIALKFIDTEKSKFLKTKSFSQRFKEFFLGEGDLNK